MKDKPKDMLNNIPLPEGLDKNIEMGFERARKERYSKKNKWLKSVMGIAAALTIVVASVSIVGFDKVEATIKQVLQYVPGYNLVIDKEEGEILALQEQVSYKRDDIFINIIASSKLGRHFNISIQSNYNMNNSLDINLKNKNGITIPPASWSKSSGGEFWEGDYYFEVAGDDKDYSLTVGEFEVPFSLEKTTEVGDFLQVGNHANSKGINIVAIKKSIEDRLMISLLHQSEEKTVYEYPFEENLWGTDWGSRGDLEMNMYIIDKEGNKTYPNIPSSFGNLMSDFYFDTMDKEGLKLVLPYVKIMYSDLKSEKLKVTKPKEGERIDINKTLLLGEFNIEVIDIRSKGEELIINLSSKSPKDEILEEVRVKGIGGYGTRLNKETGYVELSINEEDVGKRFSIYFESPTSLLLGDWKIDLD